VGRAALALRDLRKRLRTLLRRSHLVPSWQQEELQERSHLQRQVRHPLVFGILILAVFSKGRTSEASVSKNILPFKQTMSTQHTPKQKILRKYLVCGCLAIATCTDNRVVAVDIRAPCKSCTAEEIAIVREELAEECSQEGVHDLVVMRQWTAVSAVR